MTSRKKIKKRLAASLESIYVKSKDAIYEQTASSAEVEAFLDEHLENFVEDCWAYVVGKI